MIEVNSETDFVARDSNFLQFAEQLVVSGLAAKVDTVEALMALPVSADSTETFEQQRQALINKIGENVKVRRCQLMTSPAMVGSYIHGGRIGVLVDLSQSQPELAKDVAMHIAASNPLALDSTLIDQAIIDKEQELVAEELKNSGKSEDIAKKISLGKMNKFKEENALLTQAWVMEPKKKVKDVLKELSIADLKIKEFYRIKIGE